MKLKKLAKEATPGPWIVGDHISEVIAPCPCCGLVATCARYGPIDDPSCYNSEYIAEANPKNILKLLGICVGLLRAWHTSNPDVGFGPSKEKLEQELEKIWNNKLGWWTEYIDKSLYE